MKLERIQLFYILILAPIFAVLYFSPFSAVIPFYGFLLILLKHQKLVEAEKARAPAQMMLGVAVVLASFFAYYAIVPVYREAAFYSPANYILYVLGLFLAFFELPALKEALSPLFLIAAATSSSFVAAWLKPFISPYAIDFAHIVVGLIRILGVNAGIYSSGTTPFVTFTSLTGRVVTTAFVYECIGVYSALVFSIILVVVLAEDQSSLLTKAAGAAIGIAGTFVLNIVRVAIILLVDYSYGVEVGGNVHYVIGYALFSTWLAFFLLMHSKRSFFKRMWQNVGKRLTKPNTNIIREN